LKGSAASIPAIINHVLHLACFSLEPAPTKRCTQRDLILWWTLALVDGQPPTPSSALHPHTRPAAASQPHWGPARRPACIRAYARLSTFSCPSGQTPQPSSAAGPHSAGHYDMSGRPRSRAACALAPYSPTLRASAGPRARGCCRGCGCGKGSGTRATR